MDSSPASTRNAAIAVLLTAAAALPACGSAQAPATTPDATKEARPMTDQDAAAHHAQAGQDALAAKDFKAANAAFDAALATLPVAGPAAGIDDTGMQMVLAKSKADKGDWEGAAKTKGQVVRARLAQRAAR